jgi:cytidylate kinase
VTTVHGLARVVTVSATYGAGGSVVAPRLAVRLGLPFADRLIPAQDFLAVLATEEVDEAEQEQQRRSSFFRRLALVAGALNFPVPSSEDLRDHVRAKVETGVDELAHTTGAVVLGRAGAVVLAGRPWSFHVRLDGPAERRAARGQELEHITLEEARARLEETDRARARYVNRLYGRDPADLSLYHLVVDSTVFAVDDCVELLATAATTFWSAAERAGDGGAARPDANEGR